MTDGANQPHSHHNTLTRLILKPGNGELVNPIKILILHIKANPRPSRQTPTATVQGGKVWQALGVYQQSLRCMMHEEEDYAQACSLRPRVWNNLKECVGTHQKHHMTCLVVTVSEWNGPGI